MRIVCTCETPPPRPSRGGILRPEKTRWGRYDARRIECPAAEITTMTSEERLELANRLFREFRALCFWHSPPDLTITEELIPFVVKGLRGHGGHRGFRLATELER